MINDKNNKENDHDDQNGNDDDDDKDVNENDNNTSDNDRDRSPVVTSGDNTSMFSRGKEQEEKNRKCESNCTLTLY